MRLIAACADHRVDTHAIDAASLSSAAPDSLLNFHTDCRRHVRAHGLRELPRVKAAADARDREADEKDEERDTDRRASDVSRENGEKRYWERDRADEEPDGVKSRDGRRRANDFVELLDVREESVARDLAAQEDGVGRREFCRRAREIVLQEVDALDLGHRC